MRRDRRTRKEPHRIKAKTYVLKKLPQAFGLGPFSKICAAEKL